MPENKDDQLSAQRDFLPEPQLEMTLGKAQRVLVQIVRKDESQIKDVSDFGRVGPYSSEAIRTAIEIVGTHTIRSNQTNKFQDSVSKMTDEGKLELLTIRPLSQTEKETTARNLQMFLYSKDASATNSVSVRMEFPLIPTTLPIDREFIAFGDGKKRVSLADLERNFSVEKAQFLWRGLRWMCANMLLWKTWWSISPENIDIFLTQQAEPMKLLESPTDNLQES